MSETCLPRPVVDPFDALLEEKRPDFGKPKIRKSHPQDKKLLLELNAERNYMRKILRRHRSGRICYCIPEAITTMAEEINEMHRQQILEDKRRQRLQVEHEPLRSLDNQLRLAKMTVQIVNQEALVERDRNEVLRVEKEDREIEEFLARLDEMKVQKEIIRQEQLEEFREKLLEQICVVREKRKQREIQLERERVARIEFAKVLEEEKVAEEIARKERKKERKAEIEEFLDFHRNTHKKLREMEEERTRIKGRTFAEELDHRKDVLNERNAVIVQKRQDCATYVADRLDRICNKNELRKKHLLELLVDERIYDDEAKAKKEKQVAIEKMKNEKYQLYEHILMSQYQRENERDRVYKEDEVLKKRFKIALEVANKEEEERRKMKILEFKMSNLELIAEKKQREEKEYVQNLKDHFDGLKAYDIKDEEVAQERIRILKTRPFEEILQLPKGVLNDREMEILGVEKK